MKSEFKVLHLEDNEVDASLVRALLDEDGIACNMERVLSRDDFSAALERGGFDLILSDFSLPQFDGLSALQLARKRRPDVPFLFVSGTLGEDTAVESLKSGATDYVLKERLARLASAVRRAIAESEERQALKRAEEAMIESEFKYRQLFECLSDAALLIHAGTGRILDANRQAEALLGLPRPEIVGKNRSRFHPPATLKEYERQFADPTHQPERVAFEGEIIGKEGQIIPVAVSAAPIILYDHRLILGLYRDIAELKRIEAEAKRKAELEHHLWTRTGELDEAHAELEIYARMIDQELRPRVRGLSDSACDALTQREAGADPEVTAIRQGAETLEHLMDRMLSFTELRTRPLSLATLDMTTLAQVAVEAEQRRNPDREIRFDVEPLPPAIGDPFEIGQVFDQLLSNAVKFTRGRKPAEIKIGARAEGTQTVYYVRDNGVGIAPGNADKLFGAFQRLHRADRFEGVGLGLALVQRIIERHGGQVGAEGAVNVGAAFSFTLPKPPA